MGRFLTKSIIVLLSAAAIVAAYALLVNFFVMAYGKAHIIEPEETESGYDCILVLGCGVYGNQPSDMLRDRLDRAIELYDSGVSDRLLMSGDHGDIYYNEVQTMKDYAIGKGVPSDNIFMDHAGFSTYESMYRAGSIFKAEKILIVTQKYHLYRAVFDAHRLGLEADGVCAMPNTYIYETYNNLREVLARNKDFLYTLFKPEPTFLGEEIPIDGNGSETDDRKEK